MIINRVCILAFIGFFFITPDINAKEISRYHLDGSIIDSGVNKFDGVITGTVTSTANRFGDAGKAMKFTNGYATIAGYRNYNFHNQLSVSLWMRRDTAGTYMGIIGNGYNTAGNLEIRMGRENNSTFLFTHSKWTSGVTSTITRNVIQIGTWHHVALVQDRGNSKLYIDGNLVSEQEVANGSLIVTNAGVIIGANAKLSERFNGALDDIRIFDHALTSEDILSLYNDSYESPHKVTLSKMSGQSDIPSTGGTILYDALLSNSSTNTSSEFIKWAVLTLPNGYNYSAISPQSVIILNGQTLIESDLSLTIPSWFAPGNYELTWYLADPEKEDGYINTGKINFSKL